MQNIIKQIREAREKATQGEWRYAIDAPYVSLGDSNVMLQVNSPDEARYITLLHNSMPEILDALEEAERKAELPTTTTERTAYIGEDAPCVFCTKEVGNNNVTFDGSHYEA